MKTGAVVDLSEWRAGFKAEAVRCSVAEVARCWAEGCTSAEAAEVMETEEWWTANAYAHLDSMVER